MTIRVQGTAVIDNSRNAVNLASVGVRTGSANASLDVVSTGSGSAAIIRGSANSPKMLMVHAEGGNSTSEVRAGIGFSNHGGASWSSQAIGSLRRGSNGFGDMLFMLRNNTTNNDVTTADEKMRITAEGRVGIGTTAPSERLDVAGTVMINPTGGTTSRIIGKHQTSSSDSYIDLYEAGTGDMILRTNFSGGAIRFKTAGNNDRAVIQSNGNVGIGTSSPNLRLQVSDSVNGEHGIRIRNASSGTGAVTIFRMNNDSGNDSSSQALFFLNSSTRTSDGGTNTLSIRNNIGATRLMSTSGGDVSFWTSTSAERMRITSGGNVGIGTTSPTQRLHVDGSAFVGSISDNVTDTKKITVESRGFAALDLVGDRSNVSGEPGGASILLSQDGGLVEGIIGICQGNNQDGRGGTYSGTTTNSVYFGHLHSSSLHLGTNGQVRLTVTSAGNVGIGTNSPSERLHVEGKIRIGTQATATTDAVRADRTLTGGDGINAIGNLTANRTVSVDSTVVRTSGNQTIGGNKTFTGRWRTETTSGAYVQADTGFGARLIWFNPTDNNAFGLFHRNVANFEVVRNGSMIARFSANGNFLASGTIQAGSDRRFKTNIETIDDAINKVTQLRGVYYTRTDTADADQVHTGVIAQELLPVLPEVVGGDEQSGYSVAYGHMAGLFIEAIKAQQHTIQQQQQQISKLTAQCAETARIVEELRRDH